MPPYTLSNLWASGPGWSQTSNLEIFQQSWMLAREIANEFGRKFATDNGRTLGGWSGVTNSGWGWMMSCLKDVAWEIKAMIVARGSWCSSVCLLSCCSMVSTSIWDVNLVSARHMNSTMIVGFWICLIALHKPCRCQNPLSTNCWTTRLSCARISNSQMPSSRRSNVNLFMTCS